MEFVLPPHYISESIEHQVLWQTPLFQIKFDDIDNVALEREIYSELENSFGLTLSNNGGWHSDVFSDEKHFNSVIEGIEQILPELPFNPQLELKKFDIWANVNEPGCWNLPHTHPGSHLSGVYYVKVPDENCGHIVFDDPREAMSYGDTWLQNNYAEHKVRRCPEEGTMFIFPASLKHFVDTNRSDSNRLSISFNLWFETN